MSARLSNVQRACFALLGTFVVFAPSITSGCGTSTAPPASDTEGDAAIHYGSVVTYGGGDGKKVPPAGPGASGSAAGSSSGDTTESSGDDSESGTPPGSGDDTESGTVSGSSGASTSGTGSGSSGSSVSGTGVGSSGTSASGSSSGTSSGSHATPDSGMEGGSSGSMASADAGPPPPPGICDDYVVTNCGTSPCDLRANTCCVTLAFATRCLKGTNAKCNTNEATLHCSNGCECTGGTSCCGVSNTIAGAIQSECQNVPNGGNCQPYPSTTTMASAQFCKADSQCKNGQGCITQTCTYSGVSATFNICGLQAGCKKD